MPLWNFCKAKYRRICNLAVFGAAFLVFSMLVYNASRADDETRWSGEYRRTLRLYYHSLDLTPVEVALFGDFHQSGGGPLDPARKVVLQLPRAYLYFANFYYPSQTEWRVPDKVQTDDVIVLMTYPDGEPLSVQAKQLATERNISRADAISELRPVRYEARLSHVRPDVTWEENVRRRSSTMKDGEPFEGLEHGVSILNEDYYYGEPGIDEFVMFRCVEGRNLFRTCEAHARVRADLIAYMHFMDFRQHGGRAFANERVRAFRKSICRFVVGGC